MSVTIRSKGHDVVVRAGGKRVRVTREWTSVSDYAFELISASAGNLIEVKSRPIVVTTQAPSPEPNRSVAVDLDAETLPGPPPSDGGKQQSRKAKRAERKQDDAREDAQQGD